MANVVVEEQSLIDIASAIRTKNETDNTYKPSEMANAILDITTGGEVVEPVLQEKSVTPTTSSQTITPDTNYDGLSKVTINGVTSAIDNDIKATNIRKGIDILGVTGTMEEYVAPKLQSKSATPKTTSQTITPDSSYDGLSSVSVGAVTSSIDSNITSSNIKSGVSILGVEGTLEEGITPSGELKINDNGIYNVTNYASANVEIEKGITPTGTLEITENGTYDVTEYASTNVNVASGVEENSNTQWFADLITNGTQTVEIYNDKISDTLEAYAFYYNTNVSKIELPNISYLKERCFYYCTSLKTLLLPNLIGYTYQYMADGCTNLETVDIHNASYISSYTFRNCSKLTKIELDLAENIGASAFYGCSKLAQVIIRTGTVPTLGGTNAFTNTKIAKGTGYVYVLDELVDSYKTATNWSTYANQIKPLSELEE